jgi:hypothetical protein
MKGTLGNIQGTFRREGEHRHKGDREKKTRKKMNRDKMRKIFESRRIQAQGRKREEREGSLLFEQVRTTKHDQAQPSTTFRQPKTATSFLQGMRTFLIHVS